MNDYVLFNEDRSLGQNQYASRYIDGSHGSPNLGVGLRFVDEGLTYHEIMVHRDDLAVFHNRVLTYQQLIRNGQYDEAEAFVESIEGN